ncbi:MAG: M61 family metallopeptidase [Bacteroidia bacterium]|nr:M61 family metallopeptidase [Bacteroidia bacterium]MBP7261317.1 M61 family metallopeptidase [Bacteroidia bacterium]MBP9179103.1 M61 family metallopeptidase [Bacteroidia bacterium]MBP9724706.1 M61 family metallopeptidase [Bacteroidia bacterium]
MRYKVKAQHPHRHVVEIEFIVTDNQEKELVIQQPSWRPGRYELGNFAKNIIAWRALDANGKELKFKKINKDRWLISTPEQGDVHIEYSYYAHELTAGSSFFNEQMLYLNPVNCFLYVPERMHEPCEVELLGLPDTYEVACQMEKVAHHVLKARDFDYLADSPLIASEHLKHFHFHLNEAEVHLWFTGNFSGDFGEILEHTHAYCKKQVEVFGELPCEKYHFLYHILPYPYHHGVEHLDSTVIAMGPADKFSDINFYREFLGVSSHEFYHLWNIKRIRPAEMWPYDFTKENYSRQGYVYEGVTTYMGDLMLLRSGVFDWDEYCAEFNDFLQRHFDNYGRYNLSVAGSSWDTWLDGYVPGVFGRKVSIYVEGALAAFILDTILMNSTQNKNTIDELMRRLYYDFYKQNKGYSQQDYIKLIADISGSPQQQYVDEILEGCGYIEHYLPNSLDYVGCTLNKTDSPLLYESEWGIKVAVDAGQWVVKTIAPGSPADHAGVAEQDVIVSINGAALATIADLNVWLQQHKVSAYELELKNSLMKKLVSVQSGPDTFWHRYRISKQPNATVAQREAFKTWTHQEF